MSSFPPPPIPTYQGYEQPSTSALAVASLVLALAICIPVATAAVGLVLGVAALIGIARSQGRKKGNGYATAGIIISTLVLLAWGGFGLVFLKAREYMGIPGSMTANLLAKVEKSDFAGARGLLTSDAAAVATDERSRAIQTRLRERFGEPLGGKFGLQALQRLNPPTASAPMTPPDFQKMMQEMQSPSGSTRTAVFPWPIVVQFSGGDVHGMVILKERAGNKARPKSGLKQALESSFLIEDVLLLDGSDMWWLLDRGDDLMNPPETSTEAQSEEEGEGPEEDP